MGIDSDYLFSKTKEVIENLDGKDSDKLRAIELLMKIKDMCMVKALLKGVKKPQTEENM